MAFLLILILLYYLSTTSNGAVAPGDEDQGCRNLREYGLIQIPAYSANMRVLMDSWNYMNLLPPHTGAVWNWVDNDTNNPNDMTTNWIQNSNIQCNQAVQVCGFNAGPQNNWLITQLINRTVNGTRLPQVSVMIEFEQLGCDVALNCQRGFNTHVYETSSVDITGARNAINYWQVQEVSMNSMTGARENKTISINFNTNHSSFYFAIQDESICIVVTRVMVFYHICPGQTANLIHHPEIIAPELGQLGIVTIICAMNAEPAIMDGLGPQALICTNDGVWIRMPPAAGCRCVAGYLQINETCKPCPTGTYFSLGHNSSCSTCPANSVSEEEGMTQCTCVEGYYRAAQGEEDLPCDLPPSPPRNLTVVDITETSIIVMWTPPERPGTLAFTYGVYISADGGPKVKIAIVNETISAIQNLLPGGSYTVYISSENSITDQLSDNQSATITASIEISTLKNNTTHESNVLETSTFTSNKEASTLERPAAEVPLVGIAVPPISLLTLILILTIVVLVIVVWKKVKNTTNEEDVYYSVVGPPSFPVRTNKSFSYEQSTTFHECQTNESMPPINNVSPQMLNDNVTGKKSDPIAVGHNPPLLSLYGTNIPTAPEIETEKNEAYTSNVHSVHPESDDSRLSNNLQSSHDYFTMAANSAYGTII